jgi:ammonia channel protein AmtB
VCLSLTGSWGGGFLQQWDVLDLSGGIVVHGSAGFAVLASLLVVKKRVVVGSEGDAPSNVPLIFLGLAPLWFGRLGDNPVGAMAANGIAAQAFVNTFLAGSLGMLMWVAIDWARTGKASMICSLTYARVVAPIISKVVDRVFSMNVSREVDLEGPDEHLHGEAAYDLS